jgi:hypothetical protein
MSYTINKTNGTLLVELIDGRIDQATTDLTLVGKNYTGYGEHFNENFVRLLENFASTSEPVFPITGQLWYDSSEGRLKVYNGTIFRSADTTVVSATSPALLAGDIWIDSTNKQVSFSDGVQTILAGPIYTYGQGVTGFDVQTIVDANGNDRTVARLMIGGTAIAMISKVSFTAASTIANFGTAINAGINISTAYANFRYYGTASTALSLIDNLDNTYGPDNFLKISSNNTATGTLHVKNDGGLVVGDDSDFKVSVSGNTVFMQTQNSAADLRIQIKQGTSSVDVITVDNSTTRVGIWNNNPQYSLDVTGDLRVTGNLIVQGATTSIDVSTLRVEDKLIEIAITSDSVLLDDIGLDGAGIVVRATGNDKSLVWLNTGGNGNWTSTTNFDLVSGNTYKIGNTIVLSSTALGSGVTTASGLTSIGTLTNLDVDSINLNNATITTTNPLTITSSGDITISGFRKILGVATPDVSDDPNTVATKEYVDELRFNQDISLYLDITGLNNTSVALVLEDLYPAAARSTGVYAYVHCVSYSGTILYNAGDALLKTTVAVDKNGTENQSVIQDVSFSNVTESVSFTPTRSLKRFIINGTNDWVFEQDLVSSV